MKAISILSSGVLGLSVLLVACGGDDQKSASDTGKAIEAALTASARDTGTKQSGDTASPTAARNQPSASASAGSTNPTASGAGKVTGSGADAFKKLAKDLSGKTYLVNYDLTLDTGTGVMTVAQKPPKSSTTFRIREAGETADSGAFTLIDDGVNSFSCFADPQGKSGTCIKGKSGKDDGFGLVGFTLSDALKNLEDDIDVTEIKSETIAGKDSRCFQTKEANGFNGKACFTKAEGIVTYLEGVDADGTKTKIVATKVANSVDDSTFQPPKDFTVQ